MIGDSVQVDCSVGRHQSHTYTYTHTHTHVQLTCATFEHHWSRRSPLAAPCYCDQTDGWMDANDANEMNNAPTVYSVSVLSAVIPQPHLLLISPNDPPQGRYASLVLSACS